MNSQKAGKMTKKTKIIICVVLIVAGLIALWFAGYTTLKNYNNLASRRGFYTLLKDYIYDDAEFCQAYGNPVDFRTYNNYGLDEFKPSLYVAECIVTTEQGEYYVKAYYDFFLHKNEFSYAEITRTSDGETLYVEEGYPKARAFDVLEYKDKTDNHASDETIGNFGDEFELAKKAGWIFFKKYGVSVLKERSYVTFYDENNAVWLVSGTPYKEGNGTAHLLVDADTGKVLAVWHDE